MLKTAPSAPTVKSDRNNTLFKTYKKREFINRILLIVDTFEVENVENFCYNRAMDIERLHRLLRDEYSQQFNTFKELLKEHNKMYNLTAVCDDDGIYYKHFLDSIAGEEFFGRGAKVAEIGSGGGFPSLPLKIIRDDLAFTLVESTGKKCNFLNAAVDKLGLKGVKVENMRAEDGAKNPRFREKFDICCARAVASLNTLSEYCLPYVKKGGKFIAYKGDCTEEIEEAQNAIKTLGGEIEKIVRYELENCGKRTIIIVKKVCATPAKYPRGNGKERKQPL